MDTSDETTSGGQAPPLPSAFLLQAGWGRPAWDRAVEGYLQAFAPEDPVTLLLPPPTQGGPERLFELLRRDQRERLPEITVLERPGELLEQARRFARILPIEGPPPDGDWRAPLPCAGPSIRAADLPAAMVRMATTGVGTDACLAAGVLPMLVHFYMPVPDIADLRRRSVWARRSPLPGVDLDVPGQLEYLRRIGAAHGEECLWPGPATSHPHQFHVDNGCFSFGCAASLHAVLRHHKPQRVVEVGSGMSSRVISEALEANRRDGHPAEYLIIDPYPAPSTATLPGLTRLVQDRVELQPLDPFLALGPDDVLFIDSGHTVKTGGDVNFLFLEVLPRLAPGVVVHVHDISLPFEYPEAYFTKPDFRVFWTEAYLLQAFLAHNDRFEVLLAMQLLQTDHLDALRAAFPRWDTERFPPVSGSFCMGRRPA